MAGGATQPPLNSRPAPTPPTTGPPTRRAPGAGAPPARQLHPDLTGCAGCGRALLGSYLSALQRRWHPACFVCGFCEEAINQGGNTQFAIGAQDGWPYHM
ncbi:LIM domain-containing protein [Agrobacterium sp.]|uniref:LIM domain-containing protein n=1 Tax=Agrobacterium sp. TaxID=361 RepID=UPI0040339E80